MYRRSIRDLLADHLNILAIIATLALRNIRRHFGRSLLTSLAMIVASILSAVGSEFHKNEIVPRLLSGECVACLGSFEYVARGDLVTSVCDLAERRGVTSFDTFDRAAGAWGRRTTCSHLRAHERQLTFDRAAGAWSRMTSAGGRTPPERW